MKQSHFKAEKLQDRYADRGSICPADLCDIFECPELSEKKLRLQVYTERTNGNYEGKRDMRDGTQKKKNGQSRPDKLPTFRYEMVQHYNSQKKSSLL